MHHRALGALLILGGLQCGIEDNGLLDMDGGPTSDVVTTDGGGSDVVTTQDALPDVPAPPVEAGICDEDADYCQPTVVPSGWSPVAYAENPATNCPTTDWPTQADYVANVQPGSAACTCACTKTSDPNCTTGTTQTYYSNMTTMCGVTAGQLTFADGGCVQLPNAGLGNYYASTAIAATGNGSCTEQTSQSGNLATTPARICTPESKCNSATCAGTVPSGWLACIVADGDQACPSGSPFSQKHSIAKSASFDCAQTCGGCTVTGACDTPQVHFFTDTKCTTSLVTLASDTTCNATGHGGQGIASVSYTATPNFKCNSTGTSAVQVQPDTPKTVCCR